MMKKEIADAVSFSFCHTLIARHIERKEQNERELYRTTQMRRNPK